MSIAEKVAAGLKDDIGREARRSGISAIRNRVPGLVAQYPNLQSHVRQIKEEALGRLPELVDSAVTHLKAHGFHVFLAATAEEARQYVLDHIAPQSRVIKSKSNQAKEIHLPEALARHGHTMVETDLGDRINQLLGRRSGHVLAPAISVPPATIRDAFRTAFHQPDLTENEQELVAAARAHMRPILLNADVGISGANAVTATGEIVLMENEGNIRAVTSLPRQHFVIAAITKIVPTVEDGLTIVQAASIFGAGQDFGNYCTVLTGPALEAGPEIHVVLIDDGRMAARITEAEPLMCINCGSCLNVCPVFSELGEEYGGERIGGIGILQTFLLNGPDQAIADGLDLCLGCQRCIPACPVEIDTPGITSRFRQVVRPRRRLPKIRQVMLNAVLSRRRLALGRLSATWAERLGVAARWRARGRYARDFIPAPDPGPGVLAGTLFPADPAVRRGEVQLFTGCVMDAIYGKIHRDTVLVLNKNGWDVRIPEGQTCCGALHWHAGEAEPVPSLVESNIKAFARERPIIVNSAGCGAFLKEYGHEVAAPRPDFAQQVFDLAEFLVKTGYTPPRGTLSVRATYHNPCHLAYAQGIVDPPETVLSAIPGLQLVPLTEREACCGSAGTFNLERPDLSWQLARDKAQDAIDTGAQWVITANPGCLMQIRAGMAATHGPMAVRHLAEVLADAYRMEDTV